MRYAESGISLEHTLDHPLSRRVMSLVLDRLDKAPQSERANSISIPLDESNAPEIHAAPTVSDKEFSWLVVRDLEALGLGTLRLKKSARYGSHEERQPRFDFAGSEDAEATLRSHYRRPAPDTPYAREWRELAEASGLPSADAAQVGRRPIRIEGRSAKECWNAFIRVRELADSGLMLREVSARCFWGMSKVLDARADLVAILLGVRECPFDDQPIQFNVHIQGRPRSVLFVENHIPFERLIRDGGTPDTALVLSSGFMGVAGGIRSRARSRMFFTEEALLTDGAIEEFQLAFYGDKEVPVHFWGDLDPAGMAILASLRKSFTQASAWTEGYGPMLDRLLSGDGHRPDQANKVGQTWTEQTGCAYADSVLIPAMKNVGRYIDQE